MRDMDNTTRNYEMVFIAAPQLDEQGLTTLTERITGWITSAGGAMAKTNVWGRQRLAYAINKQSEGIYVQLDFQLAPSATRDFERNLHIDENVLRHLLVRLDED
jgi:small subunit ribosomal protein S6